MYFANTCNYTKFFIASHFQMQFRILISELIAISNLQVMLCDLLITLGGTLSFTLAMLNLF